MEEDIKILEEMKNALWEYFEDFKIDKDTSSTMKKIYEIRKVQVQAIENLIKGYRDGEDIMKNTVKENLELKEYIRELEEENAILKKANNIAENVKIENITCAIDVAYKDFMKQFIPKSKIEYKIEELKKNEDCKYCNNACPKYARCMMLQELMEG